MKFFQNIFKSQEKGPQKDKKGLLEAYQKFEADPGYKQKSYLNFLNFMKKNGKANYYGFSAGEVGDMFSQLKEQKKLTTFSPLSILRNRKTGRKIAASIALIFGLTGEPMQSGSSFHGDKNMISGVEMLDSSYLTKNEDPTGATIYDIVVQGDNLPKIQKAAEESLKNLDNPQEIKSQLEENVKTTPEERNRIQNLTLAYMLYNKMCPLAEKHMQIAQQLIPSLQAENGMVNPSIMYNQLVSVVSKDPEYEAHLPAGITAKQKVIYTWTFLLKKFGFDKKSNGQERIFDEKNWNITNDYCIALMEFQKKCQIKIDATAGAETATYALFHYQSLMGNMGKTLDGSKENKKDFISKSSSDSLKNTPKTNIPVTVNKNLQKDSKDKEKKSKSDSLPVRNTTKITELSLSKDTLPSQEQVKEELKNLLVSNELGFVEGLDTFLVDKKISETQKKQLLKEIHTILQSSDASGIKKARIFNKFREYGIYNKLFFSSKKNSAGDDSFSDSFLTGTNISLSDTTKITIKNNEKDKSVGNVVGDSKNNAKKSETSKISSGSFSSTKAKKEASTQSQLSKGKVSLDSSKVQAQTKGDSLSSLQTSIVNAIDLSLQDSVQLKTLEIEKTLLSLLDTSEQGFITSFKEYLQKKSDKNLLEEIYKIQKSRETESVKKALIFDLFARYGIVNKRT